MQAFQAEVSEQSWHQTGLDPLQIDPPSMPINLRNLMILWRRIHASQISIFMKITSKILADAAKLPPSTSRSRSRWSWIKCIWSCIMYCIVNTEKWVTVHRRDRAFYAIIYVRYYPNLPVNLNCLKLTQSSNNSWQKLRPQMKQHCNQQHLS